MWCSKMSVKSSDKSNFDGVGGDNGRLTFKCYTSSEKNTWHSNARNTVSYDDADYDDDLPLSERLSRMSNLGASSSKCYTTTKSVKRPFDNSNSLKSSVKKSKVTTYDNQVKDTKKDDTPLSRKYEMPSKSAEKSFSSLKEELAFVEISFEECKKKRQVEVDRLHAIQRDIEGCSKDLENMKKEMSYVERIYESHKKMQGKTEEFVKDFLVKQAQLSLMDDMIGERKKELKTKETQLCQIMDNIDKVRKGKEWELKAFSHRTAECTLELKTKEKLIEAMKKQIDEQAERLESERMKFLRVMQLSKNDQRAQMMDYESANKQFEEQVKEIKLKETSCRERMVVLESKEKLFKGRVNKLKLKEKHLEGQVKEFKSKVEKFLCQMKELDHEEKHVDSRMKELKLKEMQLEGRAKEIELNEEQVKCRLKDFDSEKEKFKSQAKDLESEKKQFKEKLLEDQLNEEKFKGQVKELESEKKLFEVRSKEFDSEKEKFKSQVKELEFEKKLFEGRLKDHLSKEKEIKGQMQELKHFVSQMENFKSEAKQFEGRWKELESKDKEFKAHAKELEPKVKQFDGCLKDLDLRERQYDALIEPSNEEAFLVFVENLIKRQQYDEAVRFSRAYNFSNNNQLADLFEEHVQNLKLISESNCKETDSIEIKDKARGQEVASLVAVIQCIIDNNLKFKDLLNKIYARILELRRQRGK